MTSNQRRALRIVDADAFNRLCADTSARRKAQTELRRDTSLGLDLGAECSTLRQALGSFCAADGFDEDGTVGIRLGAGAWLLPQPIVTMVGLTLAERAPAARKKWPALREPIDALVSFYRRAAAARGDVLVLGAPDPFRITKAIAGRYWQALVAEMNRRDLRQEPWQARIIPLALEELGAPASDTRRAAYADLKQALVDETGRVHVSAAAYTRRLWGPVLSRSSGRIAFLATLLSLARALERGGDGTAPVQRALSDGYSEIEEFLDELLEELPPAAGAGLLVCAALSTGRPLLAGMVIGDWKVVADAIVGGSGDASQSAFNELTDALVELI